MSWSEDQYKRAGVVQKKLRLRTDAAARISELASLLGVGESAAVDQAVSNELARLRRKKK